MSVLYGLGTSLPKTEVRIRQGKTARTKNEEAVKTDRTERPVVETSVIQARSSEDSKDPNVGKAHERTTRLVIGANTEKCAR